MKEYHMAVVTRVIEKASGKTTDEKTARVSADTLQGSIYFRAETLIDGEYPEPAYPPYGFASLNGAGDFWVPRVGDNILIEIDETVDIPDPRYICCMYSNIRQIHRDFKKNYPFRMGRVTHAGHKLIWDDKKGEETVNFEHNFGQRLYLTEDGSLLLEARKIISRDDKDDLLDKFEDDWFKLFMDRKTKKLILRYQKENADFMELYFDRAGKEIKLHDSLANAIYLNDSGIKVTDKNGNIIELKDGDFKITSVGKLTLNAIDKISINSGDSIDIIATIKAILKGTVGTDVGDSASVTTVDGSLVVVAGGGPGAARLGDSVVGLGAHGVKVASVIVSASSKVFVG